MVKRWCRSTSMPFLSSCRSVLKRAGLASFAHRYPALWAELGARKAAQVTLSRVSTAALLRSVERMREVNRTGSARVAAADDAAAGASPAASLAAVVTVSTDIPALSAREAALSAREAGDAAAALRMPAPETRRPGSALRAPDVESDVLPGAVPLAAPSTDAAAAAEVRPARLAVRLPPLLKQSPRVTPVTSRATDSAMSSSKRKTQAPESPASSARDGSRAPVASQRRVRLAPITGGGAGAAAASRTSARSSRVVPVTQLTGSAADAPDVLPVPAPPAPTTLATPPALAPITLSNSSALAPAELPSPPALAPAELPSSPPRLAPAALPSPPRLATVDVARVASPRGTSAPAFFAPDSTTTADAAGSPLPLATLPSPSSDKASAVSGEGAPPSTSREYPERRGACDLAEDRPIGWLDVNSCHANGS